MVKPLESQGGPDSHERGWDVNKPVETVKNRLELEWMQNQLLHGGQADDPKVARQIGEMARQLRKLLEGN